jgi:glycosyltransferase involved in cell wall biosynthesis
MPQVIHENVFFSIIIPTFNRGELIVKTITSICDQQFSDLEIIIVDDGSADNTENIIRSFQQSFIRYFKIENSERGAARNFGLSKASGQYINYFDSDDIFLPCFWQIKQFLVKLDYPPVVYGKVWQVDQSGRKLPAVKLPFSSFTENLIHNNFLACGSVFLRQDVARQFPFQEDRRLSSAEDWELWLRIGAKYSFTFFDHEIFCQIQHENRSLNAIRPQQIEIRDNFFIECILSNKTLYEFYGKLLKLFVADRYTFIALSYTTNKEWHKVIHYWLKALRQTAYIIGRKRFWAVLKKIIL